MTAVIGLDLAAVIAEEALAEVFDPDVVRGLRADSPLSALGMTLADTVCVADAIALCARRHDVRVEPGDGDLDGLVTVADLIGAIAAGGTS